MREFYDNSRLESVLNTEEFAQFRVSKESASKDLQLSDGQLEIALSIVRAISDIQEREKEFLETYVLADECIRFAFHQPTMLVGKTSAPSLTSPEDLRLSSKTDLWRVFSDDETASFSSVPDAVITTKKCSFIAATEVTLDPLHWGLGTTKHDDFSLLTQLLEDEPGTKTEIKFIDKNNTGSSFCKMVFKKLIIF